MANYDVSIKLAVAGAKELDRVNKRTEQLRKSIEHINKKAQAGTAGTPVVRNFKNLSKAVTDARDALDEAAVGTKEFNHAVKNLVQVENKYNRTLKQKEQRLKAQRLAIKEGISFSKAEIIVKRQERIAEEQLAAAKEKTAKADAKRRFMQGPGSAISSAAIGGAFPLLFGQTGAAAVGGGIGGAAGGLIGGQFGFALSILGTALGSAIDQSDKFNASLASLDFAFQQAGSSSGFTKDRLNELKSTLGLTSDEAMQLASSFSRFGEAGANAAFIFGKNPNALKNLAAVIDTKTAMAAILDTSNNLTIQQQIQLLQQGKISSFADFQARINKTIIEQNFARQIQEAEQIKNAERVRFVFSQIARLAFLISTFGFSDIAKMFPDLFKTAGERAEDRVNKVRDAMEQLKLDLPVLQDLMADLNDAQNQLGQSGELAFSAIEDKVKSLKDEMTKLQDPIFQAISLSDTMASSFEESFKGIIKGTMTVGEAFSNMLNRMADHFLDMAAKMMANQFQQGILSLIGNSLVGGLGGGIMGGAGYFDPVTGLGTAGPNFGLAEGGMAKGGQTYLVGEKGPELFTPGVSGMVTPNHALGGTTNVVVNVDASGSAVQGDDDNATKLGELISAAVQAEIVTQQMSGGLLS